MEGQIHDTCTDTVGTDRLRRELRREHREAAIVELGNAAAKVLEQGQNNQGQIKLTRCCDFQE
jgi:hypothetical protein